MTPRPFLKWAGGKTQLLDKLLERVPSTFNTYFEPFIGGGALFFALHRAGRLDGGAVLSDSNAELINAYEVVRDCIDVLVEMLQWHAHKHSEGHFYDVRASNPGYGIGGAARTIYLNKTCFNGLYRVNKRGGFNVPHGKYKNPTICDEANLRACSEALQGVSLQVADFTHVEVGAICEDFVYFDPPYVPVSDTADFTGYTAGGFRHADQERLARLCLELASRWVGFLASNSDTAIARALYAEFEIDTVQARRSINSKGGKRGPVGEIIVRSDRCLTE